MNRNRKGPYELHAYNEYNYERDKDNRETVAGYLLFNNAVSDPAPPYSHQTVLT